MMYSPQRSHTSAVPLRRKADDKGKEVVSFLKEKKNSSFRPVYYALSLVTKYYVQCTICGVFIALMVILPARSMLARRRYHYAELMHEAQLQTCEQYAAQLKRKPAVVPSSESLQSLKRKIPMMSTMNCNGTQALTQEGLRVLEQQAQVDFVVAGFPKCGTTSLLIGLQEHRETVMANREFCAFANPTKAYLDVLCRLAEEVELLVSSSRATATETTIQRAIKCPTAIRDISSIKHLTDISPQLKLIIGVRHPALLFQSFYNYRVSRMYANLEYYVGPVPPPACLLNASWRGVSADLTRYEMSLQRLNKTRLSDEQLQELSQRGLSVIGSHNSNGDSISLQVFLYAVEQLGDKNEARSNAFLQDMQSFLGLKTPFDPFPRENQGSRVYTTPPAEMLDICSPEHDKLRSILMKQAVQTKDWILNEFITSADVIVGGRDHFVQLVNSWTRDPCSVWKTVNQ